MKILITLSLIALINAQSLDDLVVQTKNGPVRGRQQVSEGEQRPFYSFRGIPYAEAPVGPLRFHAPVPKANWAGVLDATEDGPACIQGSAPVEGEEDCLFINVYTPIRPSDSCPLLSTMVWIYGGGFEGGHSSYELYGPDYLLEKDIVVVTFNYRLGVLGFLSSGDEVLPGNNGLKDQVLALKWVQENIAQFCGNPNDVTLAGQSAGSASVAHHVQSPKSKGLFQRAILQSGVSLSLWAYARRTPFVFTRLAEALGVDTSSSRSIVEGLRTFDVNLLQINASSITGEELISNNPRDGFAIGPVPEPDHPDAFFTGGSYELLQRGEFNRVPILIGFNSLEGTYDFNTIFRLFMVQYDLNPTKLLPIDMNVPSDKANDAAQKLKRYYFGYKPISLSNRELMVFLSDDQFVRSIRQFARLVHQYVPAVYLYRFSYEGGLWGFHNRTVEGVTHSEELGYCWVSQHEPLRDHDLVIRSRMVQLWTNFIKYGNPTPNRDSKLQNANWATLGNELNYLEIGEHLVASQLPEKDNMQFWDDFYAEYGNPPFNNTY